MNQDKRKPRAGIGAAFLAIGLVFFVLGISGQSAFFGVGAAFVVLGIVFLGQSRRDRGDAR